MQEYDVILKLLLRESAQRTLKQLTGLEITRWLPVELPKVQNPRIDLLGETLEKLLIHFELQSRNDLTMPLRMAEYYLAVFRLFGRFPKQILLYVGRDPLRMPDHLHTPEMKFQFTLVDMRELDGEPLLTSPELSDNVIGILTRFRNQRETLRGILRKLASLEPDRSAFYFRALITLAGLRGLGEIVEEEAKNMPITENILDHEVIGREYKRGEVSLLKLMMEKRFGALPAWVDDRLQQRSIPELEELGIRLLDVHSLEELLG